MESGQAFGDSGQRSGAIAPSDKIAFGGIEIGNRGMSSVACILSYRDAVKGGTVMTKRMMSVLLIVGWAVAAISVTSAQPAPAAKGKQGKQGQRGRRPPVPDDDSGFTAIFDGRSLNHWDGEPGFWRAEGGAIVGETTAEKGLKQNTFIIWRGGTTADFEFKADFRITETGNSGVQYRSAVLADVGKYVLKGYQADIDGQNNYTGMLYEERGRGFVAPRGQFIRMAEGGVPKLIGSLGESDALKSAIKTGDWNQIHIIARGITITQVINGRVMSMCVDEDSKGRSAEGLLGLQLHVGPPMKVEYRNILLRKF